jgi:hypothetical protein
LPDGYSRLDRLLHRLAFATPGLQTALADVEATAAPGPHAPDDLGPPVFVTSLPRAGTTLLLQVVAGLDEMAAHTYRDMPFVLIPALWNRLSRRFQRAGGDTERAHGDRMTVNFDTPEAFEEILWRTFWPDRFHADAIRPITAGDQHPDFIAFFRAHMAKVAGLRAPASQTPRYLAKNNANISRLDYLATSFPDASIVVPFRPPLEHAAAMLEQHRRFRERHARDPFSRTYMAGIGHYEFGALHRPLAFPGTDALAAYDPDSLDYWLAYWRLAFATVLDRADPARVVFVDFGELCADPPASLERIAARLGCHKPARLRDAASRVAAPRERDTSALTYDPDVLDAARAVHARLRLARTV